MSRNTALDESLLTVRGQPAIMAAAERISGFGTYIHDPASEEALWSSQLKTIFGFPADEER